MRTHATSSHRCPLSEDSPRRAVTIAYARQAFATSVSQAKWESVFGSHEFCLAVSIRHCITPIALSVGALSSTKALESNSIAGPVSVHAPVDG
jgi:xanthine dehydrogenase molybdopterin-binding subunit B